VCVCVCVCVCVYCVVTLAGPICKAISLGIVQF